MLMSTSLHLPDLRIEGFRGIDQLTIPRLGRVTLLAGQNGVGKTTVLEAIRLYADRGSSSIRFSLLDEREQVSEFAHEDGSASASFTSGPLFHGWRAQKSAHISIGPQDEQLEIDPCWDSNQLPAGEIHGIVIRFQDIESVVWEYIRPRKSASSHDMTTLTDRFTQLNSEGETSLPGIKCVCIGPATLSSGQLSSWWRDIAMTDHEDRISEAVALVTGNDVVRVGMLGGSESKWGKQRAFVRLREQDHPVPLKSLGDGAVRLFGVALALVNSAGGFLLIDEAENGIHHTVQHDFWKMVLRMADENDVQVVATTHSWDCVRGFSQAATECATAEGILVRLDRDDRGLRAVTYSEDVLETAAEQGIEVR